MANFAFIDAANLFYGGEKSLGWKYDQENGTAKKKANCDVDMAFWLMKEKENFGKAVILSGDGDFLPVLKYLKKQEKEIIILSRGHRTAREIRQFAGSNFRDFMRLETRIKFEEIKTKDGHTKYPPRQMDI
jgi:uncharacterized LabA/DUF88 family protein